MSLRELMAAAEAKQTIDWDHTCDLICVMVNLWSKEPLDPAKIHPLREYTPPDSADPSRIYNQLMRKPHANGQTGPGENRLRRDEAEGG